jgi:hypothetical protein
MESQILEVDDREAAGFEKVHHFFETGRTGPREDIPFNPCVERSGEIAANTMNQSTSVVRQDDERTRYRVKFASAHDLRRGCGQRLSFSRDPQGDFRHAIFETTANYYGATRSSQAAPDEGTAKLNQIAGSRTICGGINGCTGSIGPIVTRRNPQAKGFGGCDLSKCTGGESNPQPTVPKTVALSIELPMQIGTTGGNLRCWWLAPSA